MSGEKALIVSASPWSFTDENTGEMRSGVTVWYVNQYEDDSEGVGFRPIKITADPELMKEFQAGKVPGIYSMGFGSRPGSQGKATLTLTGVTHVRSVDIFGPAASTRQG